MKKETLKDIEYIKKYIEKKEKRNRGIIILLSFFALQSLTTLWVFGPFLAYIVFLDFFPLTIFFIAIGISAYITGGLYFIIRLWKIWEKWTK